MFPGDLNIEALENIRQRIRQAQARSLRASGDVTIVAVTKAFPVDAMNSAYHCGLRVLGENRVQEGEDKIPEFSYRNECQIRLIGHLQSNKARKALQLFHLIESIDSVKLLRRLDRIADEEGIHDYPVYLQINAAYDDSKFGFHPDEPIQVMDELIAIKNLEIRGLMTIAPHVRDENQIRKCFHATREAKMKMREYVDTCTDLSMGMSGDFEIAVEEGATHIRIGRALFGERPVPVT
ncbi:YggS family pyridoxal phosphate-dependent enzyme [Candidatus Neomarinimicrobiota bacterium]